MAAPTFKVHVSEFNKYLGDLAHEMKGKTNKDIVKGEAATVLAAAADLTEKGDAAQIKERYTINKKAKPPKGKKKKRNKNGTFARGPTRGSRTPQSEGLIPFVKVNGKWYNTRRFYPTPIFKAIEKKLKFYKERATKRIYSAKAVWLVTCRKAGLFTGRFKSGTSLNRAISAQGGKYENVNDGKQQRSTFGKFQVRIDTSNTVLLNKNARGSFAIRSAMARRERAFEVAMAHGAFKSAARAARQYPGIHLKRARGAPTN
jgi:hypothetical protein